MGLGRIGLETEAKAIEEMRSPEKPSVNKTPRIYLCEAGIQNRLKKNILKTLKILYILGMDLLCLI